MASFSGESAEWFAAYERRNREGDTAAAGLALFNAGLTTGQHSQATVWVNGNEDTSTHAPTLCCHRISFAAT